jgi:CHAD domain-containing protein
MMRSPASFVIDSEVAGQKALLSFQARFTARSESATPSRTTYYDTFDWRLHRAGGSLASSPADGGLILTWQSRDDTLALRLRAGAVPSFEWDFPDGSFRDKLAKVIEMRRLLPVVTVQNEGSLLLLLDAREKTVVRVALQRGTAQAPDRVDEAKPLPILLRLLPLRGYDREYEAALRFVEVELALARVEKDELELALAAIDRAPGDYSSKLRLQIDPQMRADEAVKYIHRTLLATMQANQDGTRRDLDSEFLHDFRVAGRRTRSALRQIRGVYPPEVVDHFSEEFRWLGQTTGPTRDLDVYLLKMADYEASLPAHVVADLGRLVEYLRQRQRDEQCRMAHHLEGDRYRSLISSWKEFLEQPVPANTSLPNAKRPVREVASDRIWKAYRKVRSRGRAIGPQTPAAALHRLRIDCKKLRYLLEFFRSIYEAAEMDPLIKALKSLQDNLGDFNDYSVQNASLAEYAEQMIEIGNAPARTLMAMGRLAERLEAGQAAERQLFAERFRQFAGKGNHARFRRLFKATRGARELAAEALAGPKRAPADDPADAPSEASAERQE